MPLEKIYYGGGKGNFFLRGGEVVLPPYIFRHPWDYACFILIIWKITIYFDVNENHEYTCTYINIRHIQRQN